MSEREPVGDFLRRIIGAEKSSSAEAGGPAGERGGVSPGGDPVQRHPMTNATPGYALVEVKVGEKVIYRGTAWALVTTELFEMCSVASALYGRYKVFVDGVEQIEPAEGDFYG